MGNAMLLDSLMRSTRRYLKKEKRIYKFEIRIMEFITEMSKPLSKKQKKEAMLNLKSQFDQLLKQPEERRMMRMFNFQAWIEGKSVGDSYSKIIQKQYKAMLAD